MQVLLLAPQWGLEHLPFEDFFLKIKESGFDGVDTWVPEDPNERKHFIRLLQRHDIPVVAHQHQAKGNNIKEFCRSFKDYLNLAMESNPILINSHSGRDYFTVDEQLKVIDTAGEFSAKHNIRVVHETHRGRLAYSPYNAKQLFDRRPDMRVTADFSHWVCVTESYLEHCADIINETIKRAAHIHARVGHTQSPQVSDPRTAEWQTAADHFMAWWLRIIDHKRLCGDELLTITTEFGPPPYMPTLPSTGKPVADQFEINCFMKEKIRAALEKRK
jgi:sugar phosphate isomerase/epimerase